MLQPSSRRRQKAIVYLFQSRMYILLFSPRGILVLVLHRLSSRPKTPSELQSRRFNPELAYFAEHLVGLGLELRLPVDLQIDLLLNPSTQSAFDADVVFHAQLARRLGVAAVHTGFD